MGVSRSILDAAGSSKSSKGIFIVDGTDLTVQNLEFKNTTTTSGYNAAGIRLEAASLTVRNCYFHDNDEGILTNSGISGSTILIETSEFGHNGYGDGSSHNMYINPVDSFTLRYCYVHNANVGHEVKTRGYVNYILYNRIGNEGGTGSYEIDVPQGGTTYIIGNQVEQSSTTGNPAIITYAEESTANPDQHLYVVNNTIVNNKSSGTFVNNASGTAPAGEQHLPRHRYGSERLRYPDHQLGHGQCVPGKPGDLRLPPDLQLHGCYRPRHDPGHGHQRLQHEPDVALRHPCSNETRPVVSTIDIGAYEYGTASQPTVQFSNATGSGAESDTSVNMPVTLSASSSQTVTVNYAVTGGTATGGGVDYTSAAGQLTFNPGVTSQNIPITVVNDTLDETNETIIVTLSSPTNATLGTNTTHTYTINDDDAAPTVQFSQCQLQRRRKRHLGQHGGHPQHRLGPDRHRQLRRHRRHGHRRRCRLHHRRHGQLTFSPGVTSQNIPITVVNDTLDEANETIIVTLSSPTNATLGTNTTYTYTINDDDAAPTVQFSQCHRSSGAESVTSVNLAGHSECGLGPDGDRQLRGHRRHGHRRRGRLHHQRHAADLQSGRDQPEHPDHGRQ